MENLIKLTWQKVLWIREDVELYIEHETWGSWWDISDGVHSFMDMNDLHLKKTDTWLDCTYYEQEWVAYRKGEVMRTEEIQRLLKTEAYDFLRTEEKLKNKVILLNLGGSHAYGMEKEGSDVDIRGIGLNPKEEILLGKNYEQVVDLETDTTIYSFNKAVNLLTQNNPNTLEHYIILSDIGKELLDNRKLFLSRLCIYTFGGYASAQLRRMENKANRLVEQAQREEYILKSIRNAEYDFKARYYSQGEGGVKLYIDKSLQEGYETEIFMDMDLKHYPLRDWAGMWNEMKAIVSSYNKVGSRNEKAMSHDKLGKHMAHLLRLYMMCIDILEKEEAITYCEAEHDLLMSIRNGEFWTETVSRNPNFMTS